MKNLIISILLLTSFNSSAQQCHGGSGKGIGKFFTRSYDVTGYRVSKINYHHNIFNSSELKDSIPYELEGLKAEEIVSIYKVSSKAGNFLFNQIIWQASPESTNEKYWTESTNVIVIKSEHSGQELSYLVTNYNEMEQSTAYGSCPEQTKSKVSFLQIENSDVIEKCDDQLMICKI